MALQILLAVLSVVVSCQAVYISLDSGKQFNITWEYTQENITFTLRVATTGWVGLGFSPNGGMTGSDIIIGWVASDGTAHIEDYYADHNGLPKKDQFQDVQLIHANETNGITTISFSRKLDTCDEKDDYVIKADTTKLIYAYGSTDPSQGVLQSSDYHGAHHRGSKSAYLLDKVPESHELNAPSFEFSTLVEIPNSSTTYYCSFHPAPDLKKKHHVIAWEVVLQPGNEDIVHHMVVYACYGVTKEMVQNSTKKDGVCYSPEMPDYMTNCQSAIFEWAVGGNTVYFPDHVGLPIGDELTPEYYMLETHYNNPKQMTGRKDSSKLRFFYSPVLRRYDMGVISTGSVMGIVVPPKTYDFKVHGFCSGDCTKEWMPTEGINVIGYFLHAHLLGREIKVHWHRNNTELKSFASDQHYDFNYQDHRSLSKERVLLPGDTLKVTCTMDSSKRSTVTYGGLSTTNEMCLAFFYYYPRQNISQCTTIAGWSMDPNNTLWEKMGAKYRQAVDFYYDGYLDNVTWTEERKQLLAAIYTESPQINVCMMPGRMIHKSTFKPFVMPDVQPYVEPKNTKCSSAGSSQRKNWFAALPRGLFSSIVTNKAKRIEQFLHRPKRV